MPSVKIIFFGTSEFAVPALTRLAKDSHYQITAVVTQPDKPAGRKQQPLPSPVKLAAQELGLNILQPSHLSSPLFPPLDGEGEGGVDLFIVASYGKIIPKKVLELPRLGVLNIHPSLLPKYRGPSPIQTAILNGDAETGVTIMKLDEEMDHGSILRSTKFQITSSKKYEELHDELAEMGAELLIKILPDYIAGKIKPVEQVHANATFTKIITKDDARIDWRKPAEEIDRMIRAYESWPVAWTTLDGKRLKIFNATPASVIPAKTGIQDWIPGQAWDDKGKLMIICGDGVLEIQTLQLEGGKKITAREFANGYRDLETKILS